MKVVGIKQIEECVDGGSIREFQFDDSITKEFIDHLSQKAEKTQYFGSLPRPFFKLETPGRFTLKGVEGNRTVQVKLFGSDRNRTQEELVALAERRQEK